MSASDDPSKPPRRWRFRITLWQLFVLITVVALGVSHFYTSLRASRLQEELRRMRRTFGYPDVADRRKIAIGYVDVGLARVWRFRVFKPAGTSLVVRCATRDIGNGWLPLHDKEAVLCLPHDEEHEVFVDIAVRERRGIYELTVAPQGNFHSSFTIELPQEHPLVQSNIIEARIPRPSPPTEERFGFQEWHNPLRDWETSTGEPAHLLFAWTSGTQAELKSGPGGSLYPGTAVWIETVPESYLPSIVRRKD